MNEPETLLSVRDLRTWFDTDDGVARAVDGVSFDVRPGETLGLVGESGCGKSVTALSILRLLPVPPARHAGGEVLFRGRDLSRVGEAELRAVRGAAIGMVFQEPMTALNPVLRIGDQVAEPLRLHLGLGRAAARARAIELLARVGLPDPERRVDDWPDRLSGGQRQRVMIAMAIACGPALLIADEPTTALDVTIQAQILDLLAELQERDGLALLLISHDLAVVAETAHRVAVLYAGRIVETAPVAALFGRPRHPYTLGLVRSLPGAAHTRGRLTTIPGSVPAATRYPAGCRFRARCAWADERCAREDPTLAPAGEPGHLVACHHAEVVG